MDKSSSSSSMPDDVIFDDDCRRSSIRQPIDNNNVIDTEDIDDEDKLQCGLAGCSPHWLQVFHNSKWLLFVLGISSFIQSLVVNSVFPVGLSTLERRFHMTSTQTGIISSWYDFAILLAVFPVCHWGNTGHKGRWIGIGVIIMGIGSLICALPHYTIAPYQVDVLQENSSDFGQCMEQRKTSDGCDIENRSSSDKLNIYFYLFLLGQTLHGFGATPLFSIGTAYIDENVSQKASPVYLAIHSVVTSIGPVVGLFIGGFFLTIYTDFDRIDFNKTGLSGLNDPRFIGAWWIGFLGSGLLSFVAAIPTLMFARELPEAKKHRLKDVNQVHAMSQVADTDKMLRGNMQYLPNAVWNILRNPTFLACVVIGIFESIVINGFSAFMPKILETILSTSPTTASYLSSVVIIAAAIGVMLGGALIRQLNLQVGGMLKMIVFFHMIALLLLTAFFVQCPSRDFVGINIDYDGGAVHAHISNSPFAVASNSPHLSINSLRLNASCNHDCHCDNIKWNPVCHAESQFTYYSGCYAGCRNMKDTGEDYIWSDCRCLQEIQQQQHVINMTKSQQNNDILIGGFCEKPCGWSMPLFLFLMFFSVVASFSTGIPSQQIMLRVVPFKQRTLGIGVHWTFLRLLGFIPGGVLFGLMIDTTCVKWEETCDQRQSCLVYDPSRLSWTIMAVAIVCKLVSILATIIGYMTYRPNDLDNGMSVQTTDSRGPLQIRINDVDSDPSHPN